MPYVPEHRQATRERILASARRLFNRNGLSEVSIDAVMAGASLTRGAFYHYFDSKEELYAEAITLFARRFPAEPWQCPDLGPPPEGAALARMIVNAYLSRAHLDDIEGSCPLIGLPTDVSRGGSTVKAAFAEVLDMMVSAFAAQIGPDERTAHEKALGIAALCVGEWCSRAPSMIPHGQTICARRRANLPSRSAPGGNHPRPRCPKTIVRGIVGLPRKVRRPLAADRDETEMVCPRRRNASISQPFFQSAQPCGIGRIGDHHQLRSDVAAPHGVRPIVHILFVM
jgi:TetR/AcrR family transcriptional regulator, transcriptional repressor for nem operon